MRADIGFAWIVFFAFLAWIFQLLRASGQTGARRPPAPPRSSRPDQAQGRDERLQQMLRHLEEQARTTRGKSTVVITRPLPSATHPARPRPVAPKPAPAKPRVEPQEAQSLEAPVDREAEAETIERQRLDAVAARDRGLTDADYAAFEARVRADRVPGAAVRSAFARPSARQLRDAFVWNEILGPPAGLRQEQ